MRCRLAFAAACFLAAAAQAALAQTAADRGFGGPPTLGPNFKTGEAFTTPDFGSGQQPRKRKVRARRASKPAPAKNVKATKAQPVPAREEAETRAASDAVSETKTAMPPTETGTLHAAKATEAPTEPDTPVPCRKFDPMTGRTIAIRCE